MKLERKKSKNKKEFEEVNKIIYTVRKEPKISPYVYNLDRKFRDAFLMGALGKKMKKTIEKVIEIKPPQIQPMLLAYKPWVRKYQIKMVQKGPLPDFFDKKKLFKIATDGLEKAGYRRAGFETYVLPNDPIDKAMKIKKAVFKYIFRSCKN